MVYTGKIVNFASQTPIDWNYTHAEFHWPQTYCNIFRQPSPSHMCEGDGCIKMKVINFSPIFFAASIIVFEKSGRYCNSASCMRQNKAHGTRIYAER